MRRRLLLASTLVASLAMACHGAALAHPTRLPRAFRQCRQVRPAATPTRQLLLPLLGGEANRRSEVRGNGVRKLGVLQLDLWPGRGAAPPQPAVRAHDPDRRRYPSPRWTELIGRSRRLGG